MKTSFFLIFLFTVFASADFQEKPDHCLKSHARPCALWALKKAHIPMAGFQLYVSADALFEVRPLEIYLMRGNIWVVTDKPFVVSSRFGSVKTADKNEIWAEANDEAVLVRAFAKSLQASPRGLSEAIEIQPGFEMRMSYVDIKTGVADYNWPTLVSLAAHLKVFQTLVPSEEVFNEKTEKFASILQDAVKIAAEMDRDAVVRKMASVQQSTSRLKYDKDQSAGRDSYLRKLFRIKSDFAE
jgi:hypothetical protein